jgi:hypothetical protein
MTNETFLPIPILSKLVEAGVALKNVAMFAGIPAAPSILQSGAVGMVQAVIDALQTENKSYSDAPELLRKLKLWVLAVERAESLGPEYAHWVARHVLEIPGTSDHVWSQLFDVQYWVRASLRKQAPPHVFNAIASAIEDPDPYPDDKFVGRPFDPGMTVKTVIKLTNAWRETLAREMQAKYSSLPAPWLPPTVIGPYTITPITHCADLYREGHTVRYGGIWNFKHKISTGMKSFYSLRKSQERVATLELVRKGETVELENILGFLDPQTTTEVMAVVEPWLRERRGLCLPTIPVQLDDEVPL